MMDYATAVEKAATTYHRTWCQIPHCVHTPFPADLELAERMLGTVRADIDAEDRELRERRAMMAETRRALRELGDRL